MAQFIIIIYSLARSSCHLLSAGECVVTFRAECDIDGSACAVCDLVIAASRVREHGVGYERCGAIQQRPVRVTVEACDKHDGLQSRVMQVSLNGVCIFITMAVTKIVVKN